ncbi:hypothetical protein [Chryseobacterium culicis]|uniref:hypothetical protein n=1 Tax=Chryseobacterium culicis TaxID=680127 RepID=UPI001876109A|nr:hypothetical protein [Chryseobacterium culicis]MBE4950794.1 hypothetical protein [Chryseobacterium culicis]
MKTYIYIVCMIIFGVCTRAQVGINTNTPNASSVLDINSSNKGVLFPQYDLVVLNSTSTPVANPTDGLIIYNSGGASTFPKGYYVWVRNQWQRTLIAGSEPQNMSLLIGPGVLIPAGSTNNTLASFSVTSNKITGASLAADNSTITLPAGSYIIRYSVDSGNGAFVSGTNTQYLGQNFTCTRSYLINSATSATITEVNRTCLLSSSFTFFQGTYFLTLAAPTTIRQKFEFDPPGNGYTANNLNVRSSLSLVITKMGQ